MVALQTSGVEVPGSGISHDDPGTLQDHCINIALLINKKCFKKYLQDRRLSILCIQTGRTELDKVTFFSFISDLSLNLVSLGLEFVQDSAESSCPWDRSES